MFVLNFREESKPSILGSRTAAAKKSSFVQLCSDHQPATSSLLSKPNMTFKSGLRHSGTSAAGSALKARPARGSPHVTFQPSSPSDQTDFVGSSGPRRRQRRQGGGGGPTRSLTSPVDLASIIVRKGGEARSTGRSLSYRSHSEDTALFSDKYIL